MILFVITLNYFLTNRNIAIFTNFLNIQNQEKCDYVYFFRAIIMDLYSPVAS